MRKKIFIPTINEESWKELLADPEKHWKEGYSAKSIAKSWETANSIPKKIIEAFSKVDELQNLELLLAFPEFKVSLPGVTKPSQNDLFFLAGNNNGLVSCTVEAKAREDFDKTIEQWYNKPSESRQARLDFLLQEIQFPPEAPKKALRYQLFHRLASAIIMAKKFHAKNSVMIIQSFEQDDSKNHYSDFESFVKAYSKEARKDELIKLAVIDGITVYVLWVYTISQFF